MSTYQVTYTEPKAPEKIAGWVYLDAPNEETAAALAPLPDGTSIHEVNEFVPVRTWASLLAAASLVVGSIRPEALKGHTSARSVYVSKVYVRALMEALDRKAPGLVDETRQTLLAQKTRPVLR